jgi:hypothetical protein
VIFLRGDDVVRRMGLMCGCLGEHVFVGWWRGAPRVEEVGSPRQGKFRPFNRGKTCGRQEPAPTGKSPGETPARREDEGHAFTIREAPARRKQLTGSSTGYRDTAFEPACELDFM